MAERATDHRPVLAAARDWAGRPMALVTLVACWKGAPCLPGYHMLVREDGASVGSLSAEPADTAIRRAAQRVAVSGLFALERHALEDVSARWGSDGGGGLVVAVQKVGDAGFPERFFARIEDALARGKAIDITTDLLEGYSRIGRFARADNFINRYLPFSG